ncbi:RING-H2 finger protein ATL34-like [Chenopodium quinoa]|uniref:RING-H2 finger protein ATL34-like n=1 Tax=Chenopodium quinoa TaxID=63459 RepID=UPI000B776784|nr:RING-H2 finger protein ATL34-like [Chenopodium quinoa]
MPYLNHFHRTLFLLLLITLSYTTTAQPSPTSDNYDSPLPTNAIIIIIIVVVSFGVLTCCARPFISCFSAYIYGGSTQEGGEGDDGGVRQRENPRGLDPSITAAFPTFLFSDVKVHLISKTTPLECAICLNEFVDNEHLRLLPRCSHVFHPHCISPWLASNVTCPVCRANLEIQVDRPNSPTSLAQVLLQPYEDELDTSSDRVSQLPRGDDQGDDVIVHIGSSPEVIIKSPTINTNNGVGERRGFFPRSHSTGRSLVEDREKYTLRLPDEVRNKLRNLNNLSSLPPAMVSPRTGYRSRRSNSCATIIAGNKPDQWRFTMSPPFISRSGSTGLAEGSSNNNYNNNNNNLGAIMKSPRSFFKSMKSPKKSPLNRNVRCDDIGERSSDRLWCNPTSQEVELEHH